MLIREAIEACDILKPNRFTYAEKVRWLNELDGMTKAEIIDTHEGTGPADFSGYDENTDIDTKLLIPAPYSELYIYYLFSKIDFFNAEYTRYNNSMAMFNGLYSQYAAHYNRSHMPVQKSGITL